MKKILKSLLALTFVISLAACGGSETKDAKPEKLVVWTFSDEVKKMVENYYLKDNPNLGYEVEVVVVPNDVYQSKIDPVLGEGKDAPDVFAMEAGYLKKYVDSGFLADLSKLGVDSKNNLQYTVDLAKDDKGVIRAASYQATPGAFFYRRSMAEKFFGVTEPQDVQPLVADFDKFLAAAKTVKEKSNGTVSMISSLGDLVNLFFASRETGWVKDNKLVIDPQVTNLLEFAKTMETEKLSQGSTQWTEGWFAGMNSDTTFGYLLPTWGLPYVLKANSTNKDTNVSTSGDWGMVQGPASYFWGGTWLGVYNKSKAKPEAAKLVEYFTTGEQFQTAWAKDTGDFVSNTKVVDSIKDSYSDEFLKGQNHYAQFADAAKNIDASILTGYDQTIQTLLNDSALTPYAKGEKDLETAMKDFKEAVKNAFPDLEVK